MRGDLLANLGRWAEAWVEFQAAAAHTRNARERDPLLERADAWLVEPPPGICKGMAAGNQSGGLAARNEPDWA